MGLEVVLEAQAPPGQEITEEDLDRSIEIMRSRVDKLGVAEPEIRKQGTDQIVIELAGVHDQARAADIIGKTAQLQFYDLEGDLTGPSISAQGFPVASDSLYPLLKSVEDEVEGSGLPTAWYVYGKDKRLLAGTGADEGRGDRRSGEREASGGRGGARRPGEPHRRHLQLGDGRRSAPDSRAHRAPGPTTTCSSTSRPPSSRSPR